MYLIKSFTATGRSFSAVLGKLSFTKQQDAQGPNEQRRGEANSRFKLRFHSAAHGKAITLNDDFSVATRDERYFEHAVVFSHRPITTNEMIAVEIMELSADFHGPLRIGFTSCNPSKFQNKIVPLGRDLKSTPGFWLKSVQLFPIVAGTVIYFKLNPNGSVLYGVDGEDGGVFLKNVDVTTTLWVVLEAYGAVRSLKFVDKSMPLTNNCCSIFDSDLEENTRPNNSNNITTRRPQVVRRVLLRPVNTYLNTRRNVRLPPLQNIAPPPTQIIGEPTLTPISPPTPAFQSPVFSFNPGTCIICMEREKDTAFTDCGHICMCNACAKSFKDQDRSPGRTRRRYKRNLCPLCRQPIKDVLKIYF